MESMNKVIIWLQVKCNKWFSEERGDVPGWVLVVLMTAGLVTGIWALAGPRLSAMLLSSLDAVSSPR